MPDRWLDAFAKFLALPAGRRSALQCMTVAAMGAVAGVGSRRARAAATAFPDLKVEPAEDLAFGEEQIDGVAHQVLRFAAAVWNAGPGPLEVRAEQATDQTARTVQVLYDETGEPVAERELPPSVLEYHADHGHWHFNDWVHHRLFRRGKNGRWHQIKEAAKQSFCIRDDFPVNPPLPNQAPQAYTRCDWDGEGIVEGLSVGWVDRYPNNLPGQWFDLGPERLQPGRYRIWSEVDPLNRLAEGGRSRNGGTAALCFRVTEAGALRTARCPRT